MSRYFPTNPSNNDVATVGGRRYTYNSSKNKWKVSFNTRGTKVATSENEPYNPIVGDLWFNTVSSTLYVRKEDEETQEEEWTAASSSSNTTTVIADSAVSMALTNYDSAGLFPATASNGQLAYDRNLNDLYVWDSDETSWVNPSAVSNFLIVRAGSFTAPVTGSETWTPTRTVKLKSWTADVDANTGDGSLVFSVLKNGTSIGQGSILSGQTSATGTFTANSITSSDSITMNIDSGAGTSLSLDIDYV